MFNISIDTLKMYNGSFLLFLFALAYICLKRNKSVYVWVLYSILALVVFFNPICTLIMVKFCIEEETYWRYIWIIPLGLIISYVATKLVTDTKRRSRLLVLFFLLFVLMISGENMYNSDNFERAENMYKIPQEVIEVCDILEVNQITEKIALPEDLRYYVRQYDAGIAVVYSRMIYHTDEAVLIDELEKREKMNANLVDEILMSKECRYVIIYNSEDALMAMERLDYKEIGRTEKYIILYK